MLEFALATIEFQYTERKVECMKSVKEMPTKRRWFMLFLLCLVIGINYLDRGNLAVAAPVMQKELGLSTATMGILFSAFAWSYAFCLPFAGALLDKIGPRILMTIALVGWSAATFAMGLVSQLWNLIAVRLGLGFFESPIMPSNIKCVAVWFPDRERALAVGAYTATEYVALGVLTPVLAWILVTFGWEMIFFVTGVIGFVIGGIWYKWYRSPGDSAEVNDAEWQYMKAGGALLGGETGKRPGIVRPDTNDSVNAHSNPVASSTKISGKGEKNETTSLTQWQATKN